MVNPIASLMKIVGIWENLSSNECRIGLIKIPKFIHLDGNCHRYLVIWVFNYWDNPYIKAPFCAKAESFHDRAAALAFANKLKGSPEPQDISYWDDIPF